MAGLWIGLLMVDRVARFRWSGEGQEWSARPISFQPEMVRLSSYHRSPLYMPVNSKH